MKITIEIPDEELREAIKERLVFDAAKQVETELWEKSWGTSRYLRIYDKAITESVRGLMKENIESITERAVSAAARSIEKRGIKKLMEEMDR